MSVNSVQLLHFSIRKFEVENGNVLNDSEKGDDFVFSMYAARSRILRAINCHELPFPPVRVNALRNCGDAMLRQMAEKYLR